MTQKNIQISATLLFIIIFIINIDISNSSSSSWVDPASNHKYDWSSLKRPITNPYILEDKDPNSIFYLHYYFNIDENLNFNCRNNSGNVIQKLEVDGKVTETCEVLGILSKRNIGLIDENNPNIGIYIEYDGVDKCLSPAEYNLYNKPKKTRFMIYCSKEIGANFKLVSPGEAKCLLELSIKSPEGCPKFHFKIDYKNVLFFIIIVIGLYFGSRFFLMKKNEKENASHLE